MLLVIGNKAYSSWSLRPWIYLVHRGIPFEEKRIPLFQGEYKRELLGHSPAGKVPVLIDGPVTVWDSLAILEYLAEKHPDPPGWPADAGARARARSVCAEMHSGFTALREHLSMNVRRRYPPATRPPEAEADIQRIVELWQDCRHRYGSGGPFLFGAFGIADAMYAPVAWRFLTYSVSLPPLAAAYCETLLGLPAMRRWEAEARAEPEIIEQYERP